MLRSVDDIEPYAEYSIGADDEWQDEETAIFAYGIGFAEDAEIDNAVEGFAMSCGEEARKRPTKCTLCPDETPEDDRLPFGEGVAHWRCLAQLTIGVRKAVVHVEKRGPWVRR